MNLRHGLIGSKLLLLLLLGAGLALAQTNAPAETIVIPPGQKQVLTAEGRGVQIYRCEGTSGSFEEPKWVFQAPEAQLYVNGAAAGTHGAGPTWSYGGGSVQGKVLATVPSADAGSVPSLLLQAKEASGKGVLTLVTYIRRSDTKGGKAATDGCDREHAGSTTRVPYTATYTFYAPAK